MKTIDIEELAEKVASMTVPAEDIPEVINGVIEVLYSVGLYCRFVGSADIDVMGSILKSTDERLLASAE